MTSRFSGVKIEDNAGNHVVVEPISRALIDAAAEGQLAAVKADKTIEFIDAPAGGGGTSLGSGWELIDEVSGTGVASLEVTGFDDAFERYMVVPNVVPGTDNQDLKCRVSQDGSSYDSGASDYGYHWIRGRGGSTLDNDNSWADNTEAWAHLASNIGNASGECAVGRIYLENFRSASQYKLWWSEITNLSDVGEVARQLATGVRYVTAKLNGFQLYFFSGTISGTIRLYGLRHTAVASTPSDTFEVFDPLKPEASPSTEDDEFDADAGWTSINEGDANVTADVDSTVPGSYYLHIGAAASVLGRGRVVAIPAGDFTAMLPISIHSPLAQFPYCGMVLTDNTGGSGGTQCFHAVIPESAAGVAWWVQRFTNWASWGADLVTGARIIQDRNLFLHLRRSGTTYYFSWSKDGRSRKSNELSVAAGSLGFTPTHIGIFGLNSSSKPVEISCPAFRFKSGDGDYVFGGMRTIATGGASSPAPVDMAEVSLAGTQNVADNTHTQIAWDTEAEDTPGFWTSGAATRFTVPAGKAGVYLLDAHADLPSGVTTGKIELGWRKNGTLETRTLQQIAPTATEARRHNSTSPMRLAAGDYVEFNIWHNTGSTRAFANLSARIVRLGA
jgi:hypothetical protein